MSRWKKLNQEIIDCRQCPRLIKHCEKIAVEKRRAYMDWDYWGGPVPNFGDPKAEFLIVGLAPAAHGANRTGRMFTGDRSGDWLYRALHKAGFATQAESVSIDDGLKLKNCVITAVANCAPPQNKPTTAEIKKCQPFLQRTFEILPVKVILALGGIGWKAVLDEAIFQGWHEGKRPVFGHGASHKLNNGYWLVGSYHPSQQNTFTKRLTEPMFDDVFKIVKKLLNQSSGTKKTKKTLKKAKAKK